ncbi:MAG: hypothetical protein IK111_06025 [Lachnospiraceae bacterium]|nr:hypothetical protein [Lachnospiraceae bacterium]MBR6486340.1 hypothetical protein [Lachnospiraceae bacterium]
MESINNYLQVMIDSLNKKEELLDRLIEKNSAQEACIKGKAYEDVDWNAFNLLVEEKEAAIDRIIVLDEGFESTYRLVKDEVLNNREAYRDKIKELQEIITRLTDKGASIQTGEERNRSTVDNIFLKARQEIKKQRTGMKVASTYYNTMRNSVIRAAEDSILDQKK